MYPAETLEIFWAEFGDIPVDDDGIIQESFLWWPKGTIKVPFNRESKVQKDVRYYYEGNGSNMNIRDCAGCRFFVKHYGNKDKSGKRTVSNYWCVKKNGFIRSFPKKCLFKEKEE